MAEGTCPRCEKEIEAVAVCPHCFFPHDHNPEEHEWVTDWAAGQERRTCKICMRIERFFVEQQVWLYTGKRSTPFVEEEQGEV